MNPTILGSVRVVGAAGDVSCANGGLGISPSPTNPKCLPESHLEAHLQCGGLPLKWNQGHCRFWRSGAL